MKAVAKSGYNAELWVYQTEKKLSFKKSYTLIKDKVVIEKWIEE